MGNVSLTVESKCIFITVCFIYNKIYFIIIIIITIIIIII